MTSVLIEGEYCKWALELAYRCCDRYKSQEAYDLYSKMGVIPRINVIIDHEYDTVEEGFCIRYKINDKEKFNIVTKGSTLKPAIGKHKGDVFPIGGFEGNRGEVTILNIFNKYFGLARERAEKLRKADISPYFFSVDASNYIKNNDGEGLLEMIEQTIAKLNGNQQLMKEIPQNDYPLMAYCNKSEQPILSLYKTMFGAEDKVSWNPSADVEPQSITEDAFIVLDLTALLLMEEISVRFNLSFQRKFNLARPLAASIDHTLLVEKCNLPTIIASANLTIIEHNEKFDTPYVNKLKSLLQWMEKNCIVVPTEHILRSNHLDNTLFAPLFDNFMMANTHQAIFVTEDIAMLKVSKQFPSHLSIITTGDLLIGINQMNPEIDVYLKGLQSVA